MGITLDEAIKRAEEVAEANQRVVDTGIVFDDVTIDILYCDDTEVIEKHLANYQKCAKEHRQLAEWLRDYKRLLEQEPTTKNDAPENNVGKIEPVIRDNGIEGELNRVKDELESCEDIIRREDAINAVSEALEHVVVENEDVARKMMNKLPSVKPQEPCEDAISRQDMWFELTNGAYTGETTEQFIDRIAKEIENAPPVTPQPKTGHWKAKSFHELFCDNCGFDFDIMRNDFIDKMNYCPNCGAKMVEPQERSGEK